MGNTIITDWIFARNTTRGWCEAREVHSDTGDRPSNYNQLWDCCPPAPPQPLPCPPTSATATSRYRDQDTATLLLSFSTLLSSFIIRNYVSFLIIFCPYCYHANTLPYDKTYIYLTLFLSLSSSTYGNDARIRYFTSLGYCFICC